jgi:hypothetical protein
MFRKKRTLIVMALGLCVCALALIACGTESDEGGAVAEQKAAATPAASQSGTEAADPIVPSGWKTASEGDWSFDIPVDWVEDSGMYYPEELADRLAAGVWPHTICQIGSRVIASDGTVEDELEALYGPGPWTMTPVTVCDADGHLLEASDAGQMYLSLIFEFETLTSTSTEEVPAIEVFNCSASSSRFGQYEAIFRRILESTRCRDD